MKKLKFKTLWAVNCQGIQWGAFQYKKEAIVFAKNINGVISKTKCNTDKYNDTKELKRMAEYLAK